MYCHGIERRCVVTNLAHDTKVEELHTVCGADAPKQSIQVYP